MPLRPKELNAKLRIGNFRLGNASRRVAQLKVDSLRPLLSQSVDFRRCLALLEARLG